MAEGAFRAAVDAAGLMDRIEIDSAGTISYHAGSPPDRRAQATAKKNGIDISHQRARQVRDDDFHTFNHILVMDHDNYRDLMARAAPEHHDRIELFMRYAPDHPYEEMPDPYYGEVNQFDLWFEAAQEAAAGLLDAIKARHL